MKRTPLYSRSGPSAADPSRSSTGEGTSEPAHSPAQPDAGRAVPAIRAFVERHERAALLVAGATAALSGVLLYGALGPSTPALTQRDIDQAVLHTLASLPASPSVESVAFEVIRPSVVSVRRLDDLDEDMDPEEVWNLEDREELIQGMGTGVVIVDDGTILTNLHVVIGASRLGVVFADGTESPADLISVQPDQDLAVIQARLLPDDLIPATLTSTRDLRVGDRVVAVGFPFGIGPSASAGVVSGLRRDYENQDGERILSNLIQFDAAANPGNSGGPLVNAEGHVVGIVTALFNPTRERVFIGIGFAVPIETAAAGAGMSPF
jgi:S1-C subfamily serine protease